MWLSRYFILFIAYSVLGWVYESIYAVVKTKRWEKRGFLYGPLCPIYGVGAVIISLVKLYAIPCFGLPDTIWCIFLLAFFGSIVLEYLTSWGLEKIFHAVWWDYSDMPLNFHGRICLFASIGFGVAGVLIAEYIAPFATGLVGKLPDIGVEAISLLLMAILAMDISLTVNALKNFENVVATFDESFNERMDGIVVGVKEKSSAAIDMLNVPKDAISRAVDSILTRYQKGISRISSFRIGGDRKKYADELLQAIKKRISG